VVQPTEGWYSPAITLLAPLPSRSTVGQKEQEPPQSVSVSVPFFTPSVQAGI
jgi:hypothetical protein